MKSMNIFLKEVAKEKMKQPTVLKDNHTRKKKEKKI